ncbi:MAG: DNA (cytosine-5-)-methyltransferase [Spirochaetia bacterium]|nr:DNA (cytosine-5-)-methyltransferase [Spirochaetia bacterium]
MEDVSRSGFELLLEQALRVNSLPELAKKLHVNVTTIRRWKNGVTLPKLYVVEALHRIVRDSIESHHQGSDFTFIDLFAGIGGLRTAFESVGGRCVFTSEWDEYAQKTYGMNFPSNEPINGDITQIAAEAIPEHDVLVAGFPCQPFSIAGVSKKNALGRAHGFADKTQGTLFFDVARIIEAKRPKAFMLENVKNLQSHDKGNTFKVIMSTLVQDLGYTVSYRVLDARHWLPQHRERIVIIGFRDPVLFDFDSFPIPKSEPIVLGDVLHKTDGTEPYLEHDGDSFFDHTKKRVQPKYTLTDKLWAYLQSYAEKHRSLGNGFGYGLCDENSVARTLSARYYKDGSEILINQKRKNPRRLTPRECARLMGFPDSFYIPVSDTRAYKQFGNSVAVPVFKAVAGFMKPMVITETEERMAV